MFTVGENWSSLRNQLFVFDLSHAHGALPIGGVVPHNAEIRSVFLYPRLPRIIAVKGINAFTSNKFVHFHQFCCTNMNYSNLSQTSVCIAIEIMNVNYGVRLKTKLYNKGDDFTFPKVNFSFINSNIPTSQVNRVYISQLIRYFRVCAQYSNFLDRTQLLTQKLLKQGYTVPRLKSSP